MAAKANKNQEKCGRMSLLLAIRMRRLGVTDYVIPQKILRRQEGQGEISEGRGQGVQSYNRRLLNVFLVGPVRPLFVFVLIETVRRRSDIDLASEGRFTPSVLA